MARSNRALVAAARMSGVAAAYSQAHRLTEAEALAELGDILASLPDDRRQSAIDRAAAGFLRDAPEPWDTLALDLLVAAGADLSGAREQRAGCTGGSFLRGTEA